MNKISLHETIATVSMSQHCKTMSASVTQLTLHVCFTIFQQYQDYYSSIKLKITEWVGSSLAESENCSISQKIVHSVRSPIKNNQAGDSLKPSLCWNKGGFKPPCFVTYSSILERKPGCSSEIWSPLVEKRASLSEMRLL